jgi:hypothetical protein
MNRLAQETSKYLLQHAKAALAPPTIEAAAASPVRPIRESCR